MADLDSTQLRKGTVFEYYGKVYLVLDYKHVKKGRGLATVRVKVRDIESGSSVEKTFSSNEKVDSVSLTHKSAQFLYTDNLFAYFMDSEDFSQFQVEKDRIEWELNFLTEGMKVSMLWMGEKIISIDIPKKVTLKVTATEPAVLGDTAASATKDAQVETGLHLHVPLFVKNGDMLIINTEKGTYVSKG